MVKTVKKYQPERIDILWNTDWGLPKDRLSLEEAKERRMILFKDRWVTESEQETLSGQEKAYKNIRFVSITFTTLAILLFLPLGASIVGIAVLYYLFETGKSLRNYMGGLYAATGWLAFLIICWIIGLVKAVRSDSWQDNKTAIILLLVFIIIWCVVTLIKLWSSPDVKTILCCTPPKYEPDEKTLRLLDEKDLLLLNDITSGELSKQDVLRRQRFDRLRHHLDEAKLVEKCAEFLRIGAISQHQHDCFLNGDYRQVVCEPLHGHRPGANETNKGDKIKPRKKVNPSQVRQPSPGPSKAEHSKKKINAKQVVTEIKAGMDDAALMKRYNLSAKQLVALYKKLEEAGLMKNS